MNQLVIDIEAVNKSVGVDLKKVLIIMREKEKKRREESKPLQDKKKRELVINHILENIDQFCLHMPTAFVAIDYYDRIAQDFSPNSKVQAKLGITCLLIACKLEECEINIPSFSYYCGSSNRLFSSVDELHIYERNVLDALHWNMNSITVAHYIDIFNVTGVLYKDDTYEHHPIMETTVRYVKEFMVFFLNLSLSQSDFSLFLPSIQATAIVYATRKATHIQPVWREELEELTGMSLKESYDCFNILWKVFEEKYPSYHQKQHEESPTNVTAM